MFALMEYLNSFLNIELPLLSSTEYALFLTLFHSLWIITGVNLLLKLFIKLIPKTWSNVKYICGLISLIIIFTTCILAFQHSFKYHRNIIEKNKIVTKQSYELISNQIIAPENRAKNDFQIQVSPVFVNLTSIVWISGFITFFIYLLVTFYQTNTLLKRSTIPPHKELTRKFERLCWLAGLTNIKLILSDKVKVPFVMGIIKPVIIIPLQIATGLPMPQLEAIILHELAHIKRFDLLINYFQQLCKIIFFFHPGIYLVNSIIDEEREICCDNFVLLKYRDKIALAKALSNVSFIAAGGPTELVLALGGKKNKSESALSGRIKRIIIGEEKMKTPKFTSLALIFTAIFLFSSLLIFPTGCAGNLTAKEETNTPLVKENDSKTVVTEEKTLPQEETLKEEPSQPKDMNVDVDSDSDDDVNISFVVNDHDEKNSEIKIKNGKIVSYKQNGKDVPEDKWDKNIISFQNLKDLKILENLDLDLTVRVDSLLKNLKLDSLTKNIELSVKSLEKLKALEKFGDLKELQHLKVLDSLDHHKEFFLLKNAGKKINIADLENLVNDSLLQKLANLEKFFADNKIEEKMKKIEQKIKIKLEKIENDTTFINFEKRLKSKLQKFESDSVLQKKIRQIQKMKFDITDEDGYIIIKQTKLDDSGQEIETTNKFRIPNILKPKRFSV